MSSILASCIWYSYIFHVEKFMSYEYILKRQATQLYKFKAYCVDLSSVARTSNRVDQGLGKKEILLTVTL